MEESPSRAGETVETRHSPLSNLDEIAIQPCRVRVRANGLQPLDDILLLALVNLLLSPVI